MTNADRPPGTMLLDHGPVSPWTPTWRAEAVLFTVYVRSTEKAAELGGQYEAPSDRKWVPRNRVWTSVPSQNDTPTTGFVIAAGS